MGEINAVKGERIGPLTMVATKTDLVKFAGSSQDFNLIHYDTDYAISRGFPTVIVHGFLKAGYLAQMALEWAGPGAWFSEFGATYRGVDLVGQPILCWGVVTKAEKDRVEVELWTENVAQEKTTLSEGVIQWQ